MEQPLVTADDVRRMMRDGGFADLVAGQLTTITPEETRLRALALAAEYGHRELVEELVAEGADVSRAADAIVAAAENEHAPVLRYLLSVGVPVDLRDEMFGATPLMHAAGSGAVATVTTLLDCGADPTARDNEGKTARKWAEIGLNSPDWGDTMPPEAKAAYRKVIAVLGEAEAAAG